MNPREPHDGLSAYFDGELNPAKQQEIQSHLQHSPTAQTELTEIGRLSEEIRSLPLESAPQDLLTNVLSQIDAGMASQPKTRSRSFSRSLVGTGSWVAIAVALVVFVAWVPTFWSPSQDDTSESTLADNSQVPSSIDQQSPANPAETESAPETLADKKTTRVMLGTEGGLLAQNQIAQNQIVQPMGQPGSNGPAAQPQATVANNNFNLPFQDGQNLKARMAKRDRVGGKNQPTDPQVADVLTLADQQSNEVVVVEITVANASDSMKQLQDLLTQNQVAGANRELQSTEETRGFGGGGLGGAGRPSAAKDADDALFVQASRQQMLTALSAFRGKQSTSSLQAKTTLALNEISLDETKRFRMNRRKMSGGFGQPLAAPPNIKPAKPNPDPSSPPKKPKAETAKKEAKTAESPKRFVPDSTQVPIAPADLKKLLSRLQSRSAAEFEKEDSFQMRVRNPVLQERPLAKSKRAEPRDGKPSEGVSRESAAEPIQDAEKTPAPPVRVLFLFRQRPLPRKP